MMPANSLWATDIQPEVLSPFAILEIQATALTEQTKGVLVGEVRRTIGENGLVHLQLDVVAKELQIRRSVLAATHQADDPYPVSVDADCFRSTTAGMAAAITAAVQRVTEPLGYGNGRNEANTDEEFRRLVAKVLQSAEVRAIAGSLIARTNDAMRKKEELAVPRGD